VASKYVCKCITESIFSIVMAFTESPSTSTMIQSQCAERWTMTMVGVEKGTFGIEKALGGNAADERLEI
jgi:hypothetical protein